MNREEMLRKVQMLNFVLLDVNLFLDTHPANQAALNYHKKYTAMYQQAMEEFEAAYGPITRSGVNVEDGWTWIDQPWPWELEG